MTCHCTHIALAHQYRASTAANDGECLAPQCPCGGYESGESALGMGGLGVAAWENIDTASTANEAARATAAKRSPGLTITSKE